MSDSKKKRLSMLDNLANAGAPTPASMISTSRPMRAARDAVDSHKVWDLDPSQIIDERPSDRLDHEDVIDLKDSIEATGQTVPILVRRHPNEDEKYLLVYGRRRLEAIRQSEKVHKVRALIANLDQDKAVEAQISENMARRDLSYIEKALFAHELINGGFGNQTKVAEVLTVSKSSISMALSVIELLGANIVRAIGPAQGVGRPKWETLARACETTLQTEETIVEAAERARSNADIAAFSVSSIDELIDPSIAAFDAVWDLVVPKEKPTPKTAKARTDKKTVKLDAQTAGHVQRTASGLRIDLGQGAFADWVEDHARTVLTELHDRWQQHEKE